MNVRVDSATAITRRVTELLREAHARWEGDCLSLEMKLSDAGLSFGATGYKLAVERGAYRLAEGVTLALNHIGRNVSRSSPEWSPAHDAIMDAVDQQFMVSSLLIPAPASDPMLQVAGRAARDQVMRHREEARGARWPQRLSAAFAMPGWLRLPRLAP